MIAWKQLTFSCNAKDADIIGDELTAFGAISVTLENADQSILFEPIPGSRSVWEHVLLNALFDAALPPDNDALTNQLQTKYPDSQLKLTASTQSTSKLKSKKQERHRSARRKKINPE